MDSFLKLSQVIGNLRRNIRKESVDAGVDWKKIIAANREIWHNILNLASSNKRILIATSLGGYNQGTILESVLAVALTLRGCKVDILLCDQFLPACQLTKIQKISPNELTKEGQLRLCRQCFHTGLKLFSDLGLPILRFSKFITTTQIANARINASAVSVNKIKAYRYFDCAVGEHAYAGCLRYFGRGDIEGEIHGEEILRKYLVSALLTTDVIRKILKENTYNVACFHHGIYVPQGIIGEVVRKVGVRVVNWNPAYRKHCFIFSHYNTYHHTMISEPITEWKDIRWTSSLEKRTQQYLKSRWKGKNDWIWFHKTPQIKLSKIKNELKIDFSRPIIGMLTNVIWDAQLHYPSNAFTSMIDWVLQTIKYFKKRSDLQLVIRTHPAEITGLVPSRQPLVNEINHSFPVLPPNVYVIPPESRISTYAMMERCNAVIIYNTKTGIELSSMGIPVIVAGEAWIRNKGFSLDASTTEEYFALLDNLPLKKRLSKSQIKMAKKYAYHFFFRRMIPLPFITSPKQFEFNLKIKRVEELSSKKWKGLDIICDGIVDGSPFIFPAEKEYYH